MNLLLLYCLCPAIYRTDEFEKESDELLSHGHSLRSAIQLQRGREWDFKNVWTLILSNLKDRWNKLVTSSFFVQNKFDKTEVVRRIKTRHRLYKEKKKEN